MLTTSMIRRTALVAAALFAAGASPAWAGTDDGTPGFVVTTPTPAGFTSYGGLRFRAIGTNSQSDEYLGVTDLGAVGGVNRIENNFANGGFFLNGNTGSRSGDCQGAYNVGALGSPASNSVTFTWNPTADTLTSTIVSPTLSCTLVFGSELSGGFAQEVANAKGITLAAAQSLLGTVNALQILVRALNTGENGALTPGTVDFTNARVDTISVGTGTFIGVPGLTKTWAATGYDFDAPNGFTITGSLDLAGSFGNCSEGCKLEISFGTLPPQNAAPTVLSAADDATGTEGSTLATSGSFTDADGDTLTISKTAGLGTVVDNGNGTWSWSYTPTDDSTGTVDVTASDGKGGSVTDTFTWTATNAAPTVELTITTPADGAPAPVNTMVYADVLFSDPGTGDTHTCTIDWGDGYQYSAPCDQINDFTSQSHKYLAVGVYWVAATVTDDEGGFGYAETMIAVYDPSAGFVTGGGWIQSPAGAYKADSTLAGRANFGFVSKYKKGMTIPTGETQFMFQAGDLNFHSASYEWLVVNSENSSKAQYKGVGTINGFGNYGFMIYATDANRTSLTTDVDSFRIAIWDKDNGDAVVYDNGAESALAGGSIVIHTGSSKK